MSKWPNCPVISCKNDDCHLSCAALRRMPDWVQMCRGMAREMAPSAHPLIFRGRVVYGTGFLLLLGVTAANDNVA